MRADICHNNKLRFELLYYMKEITADDDENISGDAVAVDQRDLDEEEFGDAASDNSQIGRPLHTAPLYGDRDKEDPIADVGDDKLIWHLDLSRRAVIGLNEMGEAMVDLQEIYPFPLKGSKYNGGDVHAQMVDSPYEPGVKVYY